MKRRVRIKIMGVPSKIRLLSVFKIAYDDLHDSLLNEAEVEAVSVHEAGHGCQQNSQTNHGAIHHGAEPINLHPASLEDFRRVPLENHAPEWHARALKVRLSYMVE